MDESVIIDRYLKPLSKQFKEALNLSDDAAILRIFNNKNLVISVDNFIYGIHCPNFINISSAVNRAILAAISDLSAMAAKPYCIFISITLNKHTTTNKLLKDLQKGIKNALKSSNTMLGGGDLCTSHQSVSFSITVVGEGIKKKLLSRKGAKPNELLCVSGNIGDAKIGLDMLLKKNKFSKGLLNNYFIKKFLNPPFRNDFARSISKYATSCIDLSDGLIVDSSKLALNSNCSLNINSQAIPISIKAKNLIKKKATSLYDLIGAGDDYELAFSVNENNLKIIEKIAAKHKVKISVIGKFSKGKKVSLDNKVFSRGYSHF
tara:strand:+ start:16437 stop:17393 length:957 start_codon:yes stop_codon:yes gene_type:complete